MRNAFVAFISLCRLFFLSLTRGGALKYELVQDIAPSAKIVMQRGGKLDLGSKTHMRPRTTLNVLKDGRLKLGAHCYLGEGSMLVCDNCMTLGEGVSLGPNVLIYDHDHAIVPGEGFKREEYAASPVSIGNDVWIGAGTVILRGTSIGDRCVVGAGCVLKGQYPADSRIVQKRQTTVTPIV